MLTFDPDTHTYRWNGEIRLSVTQVIEQAYRSFAGVNEEVLHKAQLRGSMVHLMCQFHDEDCLDPGEFTAEENSYLTGWLKFLSECRPNWRAMELPFYNETYGYPGTPDREGSLEAMGVADAVIDIKTAASSSPLWGLQTAAYAQGVRSKRRFTVQLRPDGTYKLIEWTDPTDWPTFVSLLTFLRWNRKHSL